MTGFQERSGWRSRGGSNARSSRSWAPTWATAKATWRCSHSPIRSCSHAASVARTLVLDHVAYEVADIDAAATATRPKACASPGRTCAANCTSRSTSAACCTCGRCPRRARADDPAAAAMTPPARVAPALSGSRGSWKSKRQPASHAVRWLPCAGIPPRVLEHAREVQQVPRHERRVAVREVVLGSAGAGIEVARPGPGLAEPAGVGLRRDHVAEVLQRVEDVHRAVLGAVLVAGDQAAADAAVVGVLAVVVEQVAVAVQALDHLRAHRGFLAEPDRRAAARGCRRPSPSRRSPASRRAPSRARSCRAGRRSRCRGRSRGRPRRRRRCAA